MSRPTLKQASIGIKLTAPQVIYVIGGGEVAPTAVAPNYVQVATPEYIVGRKV